MDLEVLDPKSVMVGSIIEIFENVSVGWGEVFISLYMVANFMNYHTFFMITSLTPYSERCI